jgi:hypothetical protein
MNTTTGTHHQQWSDYFSSFNEENLEINQHIDSLLEISTPSDERNLKIQKLTSDRGDSILMYYSSVSRSIQFIHSVMDIGSTNWSRDPLLVALNGLTRPLAIPVIIEIESLFETETIDTPTFTRLSTISDRESFLALTAPDNHPHQFNHLPFILLPPFLWNIAGKLTDKSPASVFLAFSDAIGS